MGDIIRSRGYVCDHGTRATANIEQLDVTGHGGTISERDEDKFL